MKIIETPERVNDPKGTLLGMTVISAIMTVAGIMFITLASGDRADAMRVVGWLMAGVGGVLLQVAVIGYGVMLGVRAARS